MVDVNSIVGAKQAERLPYLNAGDYKLELCKAGFHKSREGKEAFIAEFNVLESNNPQHQVGSQCSWYQKMNDNGPGAIWYFLCRTAGIDDPDNVSEQHKTELGRLLQSMASQPVDFSQHKLTVAVNCRVIQTKAGSDFTLHTFSVWKKPEGWSPQPTPAQAVAPQSTQAAAPQQDVPAPTVVPGGTLFGS